MSVDLARDLASLQTRARWARGLLVANIVIMSAMLAISIAQTALPPQVLQTTVQVGGRPTMAAMIIGGASALSGLVWLVLNLALPVLVLLWIHRAHTNLHKLRLQGLNYSPGWAVGSFFVPLVNLIVPLRAMRELCNRSFGESEYQAHEPVGDVSSWWTCLIIGNLVQAFVIMVVIIDLLTPIYFTTPPMANALLGFFAMILLIGAAFFLYRIIGSVTTAQMSVTGIETTFT